MYIPCRMLSLTALVIGLAAAASAADDSQQTKDIEAFKSYLAKNFPGKKWHTGPTAIDGPELRAAYAKRRFYAVVSTRPLPPGANLKPLIDAYKKNLAEYEKECISVTVSMDEKNAIAPVEKVEDYNRGLMKIAGKDDARTAAAAILALAKSEGTVGVGIVPTAELTVTEAKEGWTVRAVRPMSYHVEVAFDAAGKCTNVVKKSLLLARPPTIAPGGGAVPVPPGS